MAAPPEDEGFAARLLLEKAKAEVREELAKDQAVSGVRDRAVLSLVLTGCVGVTLLVPVAAGLAGLAVRLFHFAAGSP